MILLTGATGTLGSALVPRLTAAGNPVRALSRRPRTGPDLVTWFTGDLSTGEGLDAAVTDVDVIVHAASDTKPRNSDDVAATARLLAAARRAGGEPHVVYISIVGVDRHPFGYYRTKFATEQVIEASGLPYTVLRTTQWFQLVDRVFSALIKSPLVPVPAGTSVQPLDVAEAADRMAELTTGKPMGRVEDMGGPEVLSVTHLAETYARAAGRKRLVVPVWMPGKAGEAFRAGVHLAPEHRQGKLTWTEFLAGRFSAV